MNMKRQYTIFTITLYYLLPIMSIENVKIMYNIELVQSFFKISSQTEDVSIILELFLLITLPTEKPGKLQVSLAHMTILVGKGRNSFLLRHLHSNLGLYQISVRQASPELVDRDENIGLCIFHSIRKFSNLSYAILSATSKCGLKIKNISYYKLIITNFLTKVKFYVNFA